MNTFKYWKARFDGNDLLDFSRTSEGLLWLKLRSIDRAALLAEFCADTEQMKDSSRSEAKSVLAAIDGNWAQTVKCIMDNRRDLIRWLYENQGDMRFGAENRIFLVLIDMKNPDESWKLKRNVDLMSPTISRWISNFKRNKVDDLLTEFSFKSKTYEAYADVIFVIKK